MATRELDHEMAARHDLQATSQDIASPPAENPTSKDVVRKWIAGRVAADEQMRAASRDRTTEPPPASPAEPDHDVIAILGRRHNQVRDLLKELQARASALTAVRARLAALEAIEDQHLWPAVRRALPDGDELAATAQDQDQQTQHLLAELGRLEAGSEEFGEHVDQLVRQVRKHVAFEDRVFLRLRDTMPQADLDQLGTSLLSTAGTHPPAQQEGRPS